MLSSPQTAIPAIRINDADNVGVAMAELAQDTAVTLDAISVTLTTPIPVGHKFAIGAISQGEPVIKYGETIGFAMCDIEAGAHIHTHNLVTSLAGELAYDDVVRSAPLAVEKSWWDAQTFRGYLRANGQAGTRNDIWVIATVGCVNRICQNLVQHAMREKPAHIDRIIPVTHPFGCSQMDQDLVTTRSVLAALAGNPNVGAVLLVGLGCETNQGQALIEAAPWLDQERLRFYASQSVGDEIETGLSHIRDLFAVTAQDARTLLPASKIVVGLKCGGSDGFSGLTANPLLGRFTTAHIAAGGTALLTEIPEIFGAETLLMRRAQSDEVKQQLIDLVNRFKAYYTDQGLVIHDNPSPGNKEGGISTLEEKSLGAVQKAGQAPVSDVLAYGTPLKQSGLSVVEAPGNDAVSITALAAAGANLILFTTGRGTPLGCPVPTLKIASNSALATQKSNWIDFDAGPALAGAGRDALDRAFAQSILDCASGVPARHEENGEMDISIWKRGVTL